MKAKLLLTGASGFIGSQIYKALKDNFEVTAVSSNEGEEYTALNLLNDKDCQSFFKDKKFDLIIHAAAVAHGKIKNSTIPLGEANILMTKNIFNSLELKETKVIFLSSVSVYSFKNDKEIISVNDQPIPVTEYGESKLMCEEFLKHKKVKSLHILRLSPVYTENNLKDLGKRVFLPVLKTPFFTKQERVYSLCHLDEAVKAVIDSISSDHSSVKIVKDSKDHTQEGLLSFFKIEKPQMIINQNILKPLFFILSLIPVSKSNIIRDMFTKLFYSVRYTN
ncbi:NAD-dependent epimerase/dehydratase family protein [Chryseobacterium viscerum]|uniref:dTDP-4-dehydrorhamnose reductase n=1 Tax=Chryseobacterium viscerum TaxID=1037377 RepID=A0A316WLA1_9FLAO|nr:NAD(P)-dependent oxidoreductase [Chryseobacterium viscerum]PWN61869.1 NAD(P)-dependent oxidoreductase [Chryseobacterium viscerum]